MMRRIPPSILHLVAIRPVLFGGIAARIARLPSVVVAISGLGTTFVAKGVRGTLRRLVAGILYRFALKQRSLKVIFQNTEDQKILSGIASLRPDQCVLIRGSGVDLLAYGPRVRKSGRFTVLMASRLIREKGVQEFLEAATILSLRNVDCRFLLAGEIAPGNPNSLTKTDLEKIRRSVNVEYLGQLDNIANTILDSDVVVLPSYYGEGLPKILIEAAASGRAIITTDMPGCRDAIIPNESGILVPPRNAIALADSIQALIHDPARVRRFGRAGRKLAERDFDIRQVVASHLEIYRELSSDSAMSGMVDP
ncbi:MAG TPA: glycosyltransferase family 1 protein [Leptospiraceae bacterium]|nr:glycosyltransferase family 1 protein [Leptospiraceae bacterium]